MDIQKEDDYGEEADNSYEEDYEIDGQSEQKYDGEYSIAGLTLNQYLHVAHDGVSIRFTDKHTESSSQLHKKAHKNSLGAGTNGHLQMTTLVRQKVLPNKDVYPPLSEIVRKSTKKTRENTRALAQSDFVSKSSTKNIMAPTSKQRYKGLQRRGKTNSNRRSVVEIVAQTTKIVDKTFPKLTYSPSMQSVLDPEMEYASKLPLL